MQLCPHTLATAAVPTVSTATSDTLVDWLDYRSRHQPDDIAFTFLEDGETVEANLTFAQLDRKARAIGATLQRLRAAQERVLLLYPSGLEYIAAFFGCLYAGAIAVPMYPPHLKRSADRLEAIVHDAQATVALTTSALLPKTDHWSATLPQLGALQWLATDTIEESAGWAWQAPRITRDSLAFLQYSSGSTASPKGVMVSHGNLLHNQRVLQEAKGHDEQTIIVSWLPLYHDLGLIGNVIQAVYLGVRCILLTPASVLQRPVRWLQAISHYQGTSSGGPNFAYDLCVRKVTDEQRTALDLSSWNVALNGAEPIRPETLERFVEAFGPCGFRREAVFPAYGLAEATLIVSGGQKGMPPVLQTVKKSALMQDRVVITCPDAADAQTLVGAGRALLDQQVIIVDPQTCTPCPPDQVGEIWVASPSVAQGYWRRPASTAATFQAFLTDSGTGPFLRTGDLGFLYQGELFITGRMKDVIIVRGHNHYPQDIELTVEQSHAALRPNCGAAFGVEVEGEEWVVVVQEVERHYQPTSKRDVQDILGAIRRVVSEEHRLQVHAIVLIRVGSMAKTSSGKIQRHACKAAFLAGELDVVAEWRAAVASQGRRQPRDMRTARMTSQRWRRKRVAQRVCRTTGDGCLSIGQAAA
jgi:acyl-CoA synthetase (AMP-forming)/AMP-acid ligase II